MKNIHLLFWLLILVFFSCKKENNKCQIKAGNITTKTEVLSAFDGIKVGQDFQIYLTQDSTIPEQIIMEYGENILPFIETKISNGILEIKDNTNCDWLRKYNQPPKITINTHQLKSVYLMANATLECLDTLFWHDTNIEFYVKNESTGQSNWKVNMNRFTINAYGLGEINVEGKINIFVPVSYGAGKINAQNAAGAFVFVFHYGINEIKVKPIVELGVSIYNAGNVFYYSAPAKPVSLTLIGSGKLEKK